MKNQVIFFLVLTLLAAGCNTIQNPEAKLNDLRKQEIEIKRQIAELEKQLADSNKDKSGKEKFVGVMVLEEKYFQTYIDVQGRIDSDENISVSSQIPGTITKINVKVGDLVNKGTILAETDNKALLQGIEELKTNLELVNTLFDKQKSLWEQKIGTEVQYLQIKTQKESLENRLASMNEQLKMTRIVSPIDGIVDELNIKIGSATAPGFPAVRVVNLSKLKVKAELAENYSVKVKNGDEVTIVIPDTKDTVKSSVAYASKVINPLNRTFTIEANLAGDNFHPNMVAKLFIKSYQSPKPTIAIPVGTIQTDLEGNSFVFISKGNKAYRQDIVKGKEYNGMVEIIQGLKAGDNLIVEGYESINEGDVLVAK